MTMMMTSLQKDLKVDEEERNDFDGNFDLVHAGPYGRILLGNSIMSAIGI